MIHGLQIRARWRLVATQGGEPHAIVAKAAEQRFHFANTAATVGRGLVEDAETRFLFLHRHLRFQIYQVQMHPLGHLVPVRVRLGEVIARF